METQKMRQFSPKNNTPPSPTPNWRKLLTYLLISTCTIFIPTKNQKAEEIPPIALQNLGLPNWPGEDYAPRISPDGKYLIFQSDRPDASSDQNLWFTINRNNRDRLGAPDWTMPLPLHFPLTGTPSETMRVTQPDQKPLGAFTVNTNGFEGMPALTYKNNEPTEIYFTSEKNPTTGRDGYAGLNIYHSHYQDDRWLPPEHLNLINSDFNDRMPCLSADGNRLYFISDRPGGYGASDIWYSEKDPKTQRFSRPVNAGSAWNTPHNEISPSLSPNGELFFFSSERPGGFGHYDLYVSRFTNIIWEKPRNLGAPFNSARDEEYISITQDKLWIYFASDRRRLDARGGFDIYRVTFPEWLRVPVDILFTGLVLDGASRKPLELEATLRIHYEKTTHIINSSLLSQPDDADVPNNFAIKLNTGRTYRVIVNAPGFHPQELLLDYRGNVPPNKIDRRIIILQPIVEELPEMPPAVRILPGKIIDDKTGLSLPGSVVEYQVAGSDPLKAIVDAAGHFDLQIKEDRSFDIQATAPGYHTFQKRYIEDDQLKEITIRLRPLDTGVPCPGDRPACIDNLRIYFPVDSWEIPDTETEKLEAIARILRIYPKLIIEIQGHTDQTHTFQYNQRLSEARAKIVRDTLLSKNIPAEQLKIRGFSFSRPSTPGKDIKSRSLNRRVEFRRQS